MKRIGLTLMAVIVAVMFASVAVAAMSTSCSSGCVKCGVCNKQPCSCKSVTPCPKKPGMPCNTCGSASCRSCMKAKSCATCVTAKPCATCKPSVPACPMQYKRDVLGNRIPVYTNQAGDALNDKAAGYEGALVSGN